MWSINKCINTTIIMALCLEKEVKFAHGSGCRRVAACGLKWNDDRPAGDLNQVEICNTRYGWLWRIVPERGVCFVHASMAWLTCVQFSMFTNVSWMKSLINKCKMHIMLKLFPDIINGVGAKSCFQNSYSRTNYKFWIFA